MMHLFARLGDAREMAVASSNAGSRPRQNASPDPRLELHGTPLQDAYGIPQAHPPLRMPPPQLPNSPCLVGTAKGRM